MKKIIFLVIIFTFGFSNAQLLFQDSYSTYTAGLQLSGQGIWTNNSSNAGGLGVAVAGGANTKVIATPISFLDYGNSPNSKEIKANSDGCGIQFIPVSSGDLYVGVVLNLSNALPNSNSDFFRVMSDNNFNTSFRLYATPAAGGFFLGTAKGANGNTISFSANSYNFNQDHLIIIKYSQVVGTNDDSVSIYIDPVFANGLPATPTVFTNSGTDQSGNLDRLSFRQNWSNGLPIGVAGLVSVAKTWNELAFPMLATGSFDSINLTLISSEAKSGLLVINSKATILKSILNIYDLNGKLLDSKNISLAANRNEIAINPIQNSGIYIVEIVESGNQFSQKISVK